MRPKFFYQTVCYLEVRGFSARWLLDWRGELGEVDAINRVFVLFQRWCAPEDRGEHDDWGRGQQRLACFLSGIFNDTAFE